MLLRSPDGEVRDLAPMAARWALAEGWTVEPEPEPVEAPEPDERKASARKH